MSKELKKRILTSFIILPASFFFIIKGGNLLILFLSIVLIIGIYELFSAFKKVTTIIFLSSLITLSVFSIYYLKSIAQDYKLDYFLYWVIILCVCSDIGGYVFGKIFKWKKLTEISPKKTVSGVLGSFLFSLIWLLLGSKFLTLIILNFKYFILTIIFTIVAQVGDLTISYFKRIENIKDTGKILPGHGGIFDRIDGLMFVIVLTFILSQIKIIP